MILFGTVSVLIYNFSVLNKINLAANDLNIKIDHVNDKYDKIQDYRKYEQALQVSGFKHKELVEWLIKYGDGRFHERLKEIEQTLSEENLLTGFVCLKGIQLCKEENYKETENHLIKYLRYVYKQNRYDSEKLIIFKERVKKYFKENNIVL